MGGLFGWFKTIANSLNLNLGFGQEKKGKLWDGRGWAPGEEAEEEDGDDGDYDPASDYDVTQWWGEADNLIDWGEDCDFSGMDLGSDGLNGDDEQFGCFDGGDWDGGDGE